MQATRNILVTYELLTYELLEKAQGDQMVLGENP